MDSALSATNLVSLSEVSAEAWSQNTRAEVILLFVLQLAILVVFSRVGGIVARRVLRLPAALGELLAGLVLGPFGLGRYIVIPRVGPLFPLTDPLFPISPPLYALATVASIVLLFLAGLETDLTVFLRYSVVGLMVGLGGVLVSFALGAWAAVAFHVAPTLSSPEALFLGTVSTATSVGITARILSERKKMSSPEGVAILAGAVIDDVLGIAVLAVVVGITRAKTEGRPIHWELVSWTLLKAMGFWLIGLLVGIAIARRFATVLKLLRSPENIASVAFGVALLLSGLSEMAGLAMILGAYITGLALSRTDLASLIQRQLDSFYNVLVPVFFGVMGMLVDLSSMGPVFMFGLVYSGLAILAKTIGCGLPAWLTQFNLRGALRVGAGMVPRGEVALIVAGIGLTTHAIPHDLFGVAVMMTVLTTFLGPSLLEFALKGGSGLKDPELEKALGDQREIQLPFPTEDLATFMRVRLVEAFRKEEFFVYRTYPDASSWQIRKDDAVMTLTQEDNVISLSVPAKHEAVARLIVLEEVLVLHDLLTALQQMSNLESIKTDLARGVFGS